MAKETLNQRRARRNRFKLKKVSKGKLRLSVHRTNKRIYAQIIDDTSGTTLAAANSLNIKNGGDTKAAEAVGKQIAEKAKKAKLNNIVFDRGAFLYHGRVKALAESARKAGLEF